MQASPRPVYPRPKMKAERFVRGSAEEVDTVALAVDESTAVVKRRCCCRIVARNAGAFLASFACARIREP